MNPEEEFKSLCGLFYQGSRTDHPALGDWVDATLRLVNSPQKAAVKAYLTGLLARNPSDDELESIWRKTSPSYQFSRGGHRILFETIPAKIAQDPS